MNLGAMTREYRIKAGLTQLELALKLGYNTMQFVSLIERGVSKVPLTTLGKLIIILKMPEKKIIDSLVNEYKEDVVKEINQGKLNLKLT